MRKNMKGELYKYDYKPFFVIFISIFFTLCLKDHDVGDEIDEVEEN